MGFAKKSKVFSIVSLGGVCTNLGFIPCGQLVAMEEAVPISIEPYEGEFSEKGKNLFDCLKAKLGDVGKNRLNEIMVKIEKNGDENLGKVLVRLKESNKLKVLADLLDKLYGKGPSVLSKIINEINDNGAANLYLILSKIKAVGIGESKCSVANQFAKLLSNLDDVGASNFALILGKDEEGSKYSVLDNSLINVFGVDSLVGILEKLDEQGIHNLVILLKQKESAITKVFIRVLNNLSSAGATNFSKILKALSEQETFNFSNVLVGKNLDIDKLVEKINDEKFNTNTFVDKLCNGGKNLKAEDFINEKGLGVLNIDEHYF